MKRWKKILIIAGVSLGVVIVGFVSWVGIELARFSKIRHPAETYRPNIPPANEAGRIWNQFRLQRPYPYQTIACKRLNDERLVIILSEPAPSLRPPEVESLAKTTFGSDFVSSQWLRWYIGMDGWVEDLVVTVRQGNPAPAEPLDDPRLRDRVALLHYALFGTVFGADLEMIGGSPSAQHHFGAAPNLHVLPHDLNAWLTDSALTWNAVADDSAAPVTWSALCADKVTGTYRSEDGRLVMLTFPTELLAHARENPIILKSMQAPFRQFAIASEAVFGGVWTDSGQAALFARSRTEPFDVLPPLRFETFELLAAESSDELSQSYERNTLFAGKLSSGPYLFRDWAPVYLSEPLVNTEFGALLNITDQMLKSWSQAGAVEYLYFTYAKPPTFPFHGEALSEVLERKFRTRSVLFNWNTAGSAAVVKREGLSTLCVNATAALPVTYGADGTTKREGGRDLLEYEENAYKYFAELRDPNLCRVAQYTVLYQVFRAIAKDLTSSVSSMPQTSQCRQATSRSKARDLLASDALALLQRIQSGKIRRPRPLVRDLLQMLEDFRRDHPDVNNTVMANILVDRFSEDACRYQAQRRAEFEKARADFLAAADSFDTDIARLGRLLANTSPVDSKELSQLRRLRPEELKRRRQDLEKRKQQLEAMRRDPLQEIGRALAAVAARKASLEPICNRFVACNTNEPNGCIKTPSIVLSWDRANGLFTVGGHNLTARALKFEPSKTVREFAIVEVDDGTVVVQYNPRLSEYVEAHANELARKVEHGGERNAAALAKLAKDPVPVRSPAAALELKEPPLSIGNKAGFGRLGGRVYQEKKLFVDDLRAIAEKNDCCAFVARDEQEVAYMAKPNAKPPPAVVVYEFPDNISLIEYLGSGNRKPVIFLDQPQAHVEALGIALADRATGTPDFAALAKIFGSEPKGARGISVFSHVDLDGRRSLLRVAADSLSDGGRRLFEKLGTLHPKDVWKAAKVRTIDQPRLAEMVEAAGWDRGRDGIPTGIMVTLEPRPADAPFQAAIVAGYTETRFTAGTTELAAVNQKVLSTVSERGGTLGEYLMTVRNQLRAMPQSELQRLVLVVEDRETKVLVTRIELRAQNEPGA
jgi:hypothetical protein